MGTQRGLLSATWTMLALLFLFVPLAVVALFSFNSTAGLSFPFSGFSLRWYESLFSNAEFVNSAVNSLIVATSVAVLTIILGTAASYGLSRIRGRGRGAMTAVFFLPLTLPGLFIGVALLILFGRLHIQLSLFTVVAAHLVYVLPYFMLIGNAAFGRMDVAMEEAATDLGATPGQVFFKVLLPQLWPVLVGAGALAFVLSFDEFVITFFVVGNQPTLPLFIWSSLRRTVTPEINAVSTLLVVTSLLAFAVAFLFAAKSQRAKGTADALIIPSTAK